jgi:hypothetical protein
VVVPTPGIEFNTVIHCLGHRNNSFQGKYIVIKAGHSQISRDDAPTLFRNFPPLSRIICASVKVAVWLKAQKSEDLHGNGMARSSTTVSRCIELFACIFVNWNMTGDPLTTKFKNGMMPPPTGSRSGPGPTAAKKQKSIIET